MACIIWTPEAIPNEASSRFEYGTYARRNTITIYFVLELVVYRRIVDVIHVSPGTKIGR